MQNTEEPIDPIAVLDRLSILVSYLHRRRKPTTAKRRLRYHQMAQDQIRLLQDLWDDPLREE